MEQRIGSFEAKNRFSELLDLVSTGHEVVITRHGQEVAKLTPVNANTRSGAHQAVQAWRQARKSIRLHDGTDSITLRQLIDEGKR